MADIFLTLNYLSVILLLQLANISAFCSPSHLSVDEFSGAATWSLGGEGQSGTCCSYLMERHALANYMLCF